MRRLLAVAALAAAFVSPSAAQAAVEFGRDCGGVLDLQCHGRVCHMDCFAYDCLVWLDPLHDPFTAVCVGTVTGEA